MTDTSNTGGRFDSAIQRAKAALEDLRGQLAEKVDEIGQDVNTKLDEIQTAIDEIQTAWAERGAHPDNSLPGQPGNPLPGNVSATQLPADAPTESLGNAPQQGGVAPPQPG